MAGMKGIGMFTKLFKRKPGGTVVGNLIRQAANKISKGKLGNGAMMLRDGESTDEANNRLAYQAGVASEAFNQSQSDANQLSDRGVLDEKTITESFTKGTFAGIVKKNAGLIVAAGVGVLLLIVSIFKRK